MRNKSKQMARKNAIARWQRDDEANGQTVDGGKMTSKPDQEVFHCSGCRGKRPFDLIETKQRQRKQIFKCTGCGATLMRPDPAQFNTPMGMFLLDSIKKRGMKGMSLDTYSMLTEAGCCPIDEQPFLDEKGITLRGTA